MKKYFIPFVGIVYLWNEKRETPPSFIEGCFYQGFLIAIVVILLF